MSTKKNVSNGNELSSSKTDRIVYAVTKEEKQVLKDVAKQSNCSLSELIRNSLNFNDITKIKDMDEELKELKKNVGLIQQRLSESEVAVTNCRDSIWNFTKKNKVPRKIRFTINSEIYIEFKKKCDEKNISVEDAIKKLIVESI